MEQSRTISALGGSVLVLNRYYLAVHVVSVRRALVLLYRDLAEVIHVLDGKYSNYDFESWKQFSEYTAVRFARVGNREPYGGEAAKNGHGSYDNLAESDWVRGINFWIQAPRVVRLHYYEQVPKISLRFNRRNLFARDGHRCQYCGRKPPLGQLSIDHVRPRSRGGKTTWENVVCCCLPCNCRKGNSTPAEAGLTLIQKPRRPAHSPQLTAKLTNPKYQVWQTFLPRLPVALEAS
jgi:5-methylcytosine-specific restriction endonuclease McrA